MKTLIANSESGSALVVVLSVVATLAVGVVVALDYTSAVRHHVNRSDVLQSAISVGDGVLEHEFSYWRETCRSNTDASLGTSSFSTIPLPTQSQFPNITNFSAQRAPADFTQSQIPTVTNFQVIAVDPQMRPIASGGPLIPAVGMSPVTTTLAYLGEADVTLPVQSNRITAKVRRVFQKEQISPWNWAIFYTDLLEIHPGAPMFVNGWVHTNGTLYTGHNLLTFQSKVTYVTDWVIGFAPGDSRSPTGSNPEVPTSPNYPSNLPPAYDVAHQPFGLDATRIFSTTDTNPNNDSYHELIEPPVAGYSDPLDGKRYYDQAGVKITVDASNNVTIRDQNDNIVTASSPGQSGVLYNTFASAITTNQTIQDNRENASVRLVTLDVGAVSTKIRNGTLSPFNNIIYINDSSAGATGGTPKRGVRLKNGATMPTNGLTVASANPVYIQGDYNTGGTPPSNSGNYSQPQVTGYTRAPCAVIGDAVNILSNAWNDSNSTASLSSRVASNTTVNTAIISGIVPSANNYYSGGAENFPRFLEDWSGGKSLTYYGSMVELYQSRQAIGHWGSANVYNPPNRQWFFDTNFQIYTPPGSLVVYSYTKGRWYLAQ